MNRHAYNDGKPLPRVVRGEPGTPAKPEGGVAPDGTASVRGAAASGSSAEPLGAVDWIESAIAAPDDRPDEWAVKVYRFGSRRLRLARPREPDRLLEDPAVLEASKRHDYMPYWAYVWPGAVLLADELLRRSWPAGLRAVEIGCGLGLAGLAALAAGLSVTFTDYSPAALALAAHNARLNGFDRFQTALLDWADPVSARFDVLLGADVLYEARCVPDVLRVLECSLAPGGLALLSDPGRSVADPFLELARCAGHDVLEISVARRDLPVRPRGGRIFQVRRAR